MQVCHINRRRIKTEQKTKVIASIWEEEFIKFLAALASLSRTILKNRMNSSNFFLTILVQLILLIKIVLSKTASAARNWINSFFSNRSDDLWHFFCLYPSSMLSTSLRKKSEIMWKWNTADSTIFKSFNRKRGQKLNINLMRIY